MRLLVSALCATVASGLLCGCAGNFSAPEAPAPNAYDGAAPARAVQVLHELVPATKTEPHSGIYVSQFYGNDILGYRSVDKGNRGPICRVRSGPNVNDVAVDGKGNLIDPDGESKYVIVFKGAQMCGERLGSFLDTYGQPSDASSPNAATGKIAVGNIRDRSGKSPGSLSICTLRAGCTSNLTNPQMFAAGGIAMSNTGDCWVDAKTSYRGGAALIYFKGCKGGGEAARGFKNSSFGGIDIDNKGNLVIVDEEALTVYVYRGCDPACEVAGGPFPLKGESFYGKLNAANTDYVAVDETNGAVDLYSYTTKAIKFEYRFKTGLSTSLEPEGIAQNPRSLQ